MLSPTPLSLLCAVLLFLPLAIYFSITTTATVTGNGATTTRKTNVHPVTSLLPTIETMNQTIMNKTAASPPAPPPYPAEDDEDSSLLQRAALVDQYPAPPLGPPRKLAFLFLTTTPLPLAPLWELYFNQTPKNLYNIYVHADPSSNYDRPFEGVFAHRVMPSSKPTSRHSSTLIAAARRSISHALLHDPLNSMFAILSPSCVPLHSFNFTYNTLMRSNKSFIEILKNERGAYIKWQSRGKDVMLPEVPFGSFRIGSQFFVLTHGHARIVVSDQLVWSKFKIPCLDWATCYPEEQYFGTLMSMMDPRGCVPATLTHVDWRGQRGGHPRTYYASDVGPDLIVRLRKGKPRYGDEGTNGSDSSLTEKHDDPFLFARKFSPDSIQPLLSIANDVIFKD